MTFRVGMPVVAVDVEGAPELTKNRVYTIGGIIPPRLAVWRGATRLAIGLTLLEVELPRPYDDFAPERFRPAVSPKQEVSFTTGAPIDSERWDNRRRVVEPMPVDGWRVGV